MGWREFVMWGQFMKERNDDAERQAKRKRPRPGGDAIDLDAPGAAEQIARAAR